MFSTECRNLVLALLPGQGSFLATAYSFTDGTFIKVSFRHGLLELAVEMPESVLDSRQHVLLSDFFLVFVEEGVNCLQHWFRKSLRLQIAVVVDTKTCMAMASIDEKSSFLRPMRPWSMIRRVAAMRYKYARIDLTPVQHGWYMRSQSLRVSPDFMFSLEPYLLR